MLKSLYCFSYIQDGQVHVESKRDAWKSMKYILQYLKNTKDYGVLSNDL